MKRYNLPFTSWCGKALLLIKSTSKGLSASPYNLILLSSPPYHASPSLERVLWPFSCTPLPPATRQAECCSHLSVTMMADGWAHAVMKVTMKRKIKNGIRVLQARLHFPDTA